MNLNNSRNEEDKKIETLDMNEPIKDLPTSKFKSILDVEKQQEEMLNAYERQHVKEEDVKIPDLSNDVRILEQKLKAKQHSVSIYLVVISLLYFGICILFDLSTVTSYPCLCNEYIAPSFPISELSK